MRSKVIFRVDGNVEIGMGHITRCTALADMLRNDFECILASRFIGNSSFKNIQKYFDEIIPLDNNFHEIQFLNLLVGDELVVLDNYFYSKQFRENIKAKGCKLICIDDEGGDFRFCDLIINHGPQITSNDYLFDEGTKLLLGLDYVLLRQPFLKYAKKTPKPKIENSLKIFVCFGGSDFINLTCRTIKRLIQLRNFKEISVVIGNAYENISQLKSLILNFNNIKLYQGLDANEFIKILSQSDIAIVPSSSVLFEALAIKKPVITGYYANNQKGISDYFLNKKIGHVLGKFIPENIVKDHFTLDDRIDDLENSIIDGFSAERILKFIQELNHD